VREVAKICDLIKSHEHWSRAHVMTTLVISTELLEISFRMGSSPVVLN